MSAAIATFLHRIWDFRLAFVAALLLTTIASLLPGDQINSSLAQYDKFLHGGAWLVIAWFATSAFALQAKARWMALALIVWSFAIELAQQWVPMRAFEWADLVANSSGVVVGVVLARYTRHLPLFTRK